MVEIAGTTLGHYTILEELGAGGMASIYHGRDTVLDRDVAVKILHPHLCRSKADRERFEREARLVSKLRHPQIIEVYEYSGSDSGPAYFVTEFIKGKNLRAYVEGIGALLPEVAAMIVLDVCAPLKYAHSMNVIHRDIKPENIMISEDGLLKLTDFGLAQIMDMESLTITGGLVGSPAYMSPEQVEGKRASARSDIFSLGTLMYWLCSGQHPFQGPTTAAVLKAIAEGRYTDPREIVPGIPDLLVRVISRCLMTDPEERFPDVASLENDLQTFLVRSGCESPERHVREFFLSPHTYQERMGKTLVSHFLSQGKESLASRNFRDSLVSFGRVLALDPSNQEALSLVTASQKGKRRRSAAAAILVLGISAGGIVYLFRGQVPHGDDGRIGATARDTTIGAPSQPSPQGTRGSPGAAGSAIPRKPEGSQAQLKVTPLSPAHKIQPTHLQDSTEARRGALRLTTLPWARVFVDDRYIGDTPFVKDIDLDEGTHEVRLENPYCLSYKEIVHILQGKTLDKRVRLVPQKQEGE